MTSDSLDQRAGLRAYRIPLAWSAALGFIFWGDVPTLALLVGSAIVVGSGPFLLWHETSKKPVAAD